MAETLPATARLAYSVPTLTGNRVVDVPYVQADPETRKPKSAVKLTRGRARGAMAKRQRLGEILMNIGLINETQLSTALHSQKTWGGKLGSTLVRMGFASEEGILESLSAQLRLPSADFRKLSVSPKAIKALPFQIAEKYIVIPVALKEEMGKKTVILAMSDPTNLNVISEIEFQTSVRVRPVVGAESSIIKAIDRYYREKNFKSDYGAENRVAPSLVDETEEMVVLAEGDERSVSMADLGALTKALVKVLVRKGVLSEEELEDALREIT